MSVFGKIKKITSTKSIKSVATLASATAGGQLVLVLASPLLTRLYTPEQFGVLAIFSSMLGVIVVVSSLRYELAIPLPRSQRNGKSLLSIALGINVLWAALVLVLVSWLREPVAELTGVPSLVSFLWLLPIAVLCMGSYRSLNFWAVRNKDYRRIAKTKISQSISNVVIQVSGGLVGLGALGLLLGQVAGQAVGVLRLGRGLTLRALFLNKGANRSRTWVLVRKYSRFPKYDVPAAFVNTVSNELPQLMFTALFNPAIAGFYLLAQRVLASPLNLVGQAVAQVLYGNAGEAIATGTLGVIVSRVVLTLTALVVLPSLVIFFWGDELFALIFGERWREAGQVAAILMLGIAAQFVYSPISLTLLAMEGQHINLGLNLTMILLRGLGIYWGWLQSDALLAVLGFSLAGFFTYVLGITLVISRSWTYNK